MCSKLPPSPSHFDFVFVFAEANRATSLRLRDFAFCLRPAEIWGEDDVSLKRRSITGSHVAHVTGSVWQRLLGARVHDMTRFQLDDEACVGGRLQQLPCDERADVRGACVVLHVSIVSTMQKKAGFDAVFPHQPVARCPCSIVACGDYTTCGVCLQLRHGVFILKQSSTQCATRC